MSSTPRKSAELFVEPLEQRIAPTGLVAITNPDPTSSIGKGDPRYIDYNTVPADGRPGFVAGSTYGVNQADIYAIKLTGDGSVDPNTGLSNGDKLVIFNAVQGFNFANPFIQSANGTLVAFFRDTDVNGDTSVHNDQLVGISVSKGSVINVNGTVNGDIVANFGPHLNDGAGAIINGALKIKQSIAGINVVGNVTGNVIAGGSIDSVAISGNVGSILAGTAGNGVPFFFGDPGVVSGTADIHLPKVNVAGRAITNVSVSSITNVIRAGDGGLFSDGGAVLNITVQNDFDGFTILSGNGGDGNSGGHAGSGGQVANLLVKGVTSPNAGTTVGGLISVLSGHGGVNADVRGGKGGLINGVAIGYDSFDPGSDVGQVSVDHPNDALIIHAGDGGVGRRGGVGGGVDNVLAVTSVIFAGNPNNAETQVLSGGGGASTVSDTGRGGRGGDMNQILAENLLVPDATMTPAIVAGSILVQGGDGGAGAGGGNVGAVNVLGGRVTVNAGNGTDGFGHGGGGGSLDQINVLNTSNIFATDVTLNAGAAGSAASGKGGVGGSISTVRILDAHLNSLTINGGTHANGGSGGNGRGGAGGTVSDLIINDSGAFLAQGAPVVLRTGSGGDGTTGGGSGGDLSTIQIIGTDLAYNASTGNGGSVTGGGDGDAGSGGAIVNVGIANQPVDVTQVTLPSGVIILRTQISNANTATVTTGNGGTAATGAGGAGGDITKLDIVSSVNLTTQPDLTLPGGFQPDNFNITAGAGGSGGSAAGKGGDITSSAAVSLFGAITSHAGNAGTDGGAVAAGGTIDGFVAAALGHITLAGGNGGAGGAGGSVTNTGTNLVPVTFTDVFGNVATRLTNNSGGLTVQAGAGSVGNGVGGVGGSIVNFSGYTSQGGVTSMTAGAGGSSAGKRSGAGGNVDQIKLTGVFDGISTGSLVTVDAGDGGSAPNVKRGAAGGTASNITIYNTDAGTVVHHIAAGDGGAGIRAGGVGGSVTDVHVGEVGQAVDIGFRDGRTFGYDAATQAGGIFAGLGGGSNRGNALSGNVNNITAAAIASIVAGKAPGVHLANTVDNIYLDGLARAVASANGAFLNFDAAQAGANGLPTANMVGGIADPLAAGASTFKLNVDGLIAAVNLTGNRNFVPEALLTLDSNAQLFLVDPQEPNPNPVIIAG